jgi:glycerol-3-phosphate acyltransferase PlsY
MSLLLVWRHSANISRLFAGTEGKIGAKAAAPAPAAPPHRPHHPRHHATHRHTRAQRLHK